MSTRGFLGFVVDGAEKVAYNHCDSYPEALGLSILGWAGAACADAERLEATVEAARALRVVSADSAPTPDDVRDLRPWTETHVGDQSVRDWYCLLRNTQGQPEEVLAAGVLVDASKFPLDSLFAEWGYLVDLDAGTFEAYRGFQRERHDRGRYAARPPYVPAHREESDARWYPVALAGAWDLSALPTDEEFLDALRGPAEDDEDEEVAP